MTLVDGEKGDENDLTEIFIRWKEITQPKLLFTRRKFNMNTQLGGNDQKGIQIRDCSLFREDRENIKHKKQCLVSPYV
jgi:hypothetical protein